MVVFLSVYQRRNISLLNRININITGASRSDKGFITWLSDNLKASDFPNQVICFEITESDHIRDWHQANRNAMALTNLGFQLAIDDFGTGYSCLSYLLDLPVSTLKIDGSFVRKLGTQPENDGIVSAIMSLGHGLGLEVVAECVETPEQLRFLKTNGCDIIQGYYFSKPLLADDLAQYVLENYPQHYQQNNKSTINEQELLSTAM